ncbi:magnesium protoporphyrin IX methyltransferase [filamentous cyanobacterium LEGE 11480]|uniref:Magnesium protoporphyrin IX methyltransferase n=1 Tax=Romeriopsis navalis LEGE 11480 TaxID=2777977 RepID=A0A928VU94_9CYAN|nr:magnesium protoporphyrin IX methyltransferase [Romeriopsis navalis]MBE9032647.1 magnesium protoporphyrin IX methyltransferase [Romeriopsis navalis LEGE 11480]
MNTVDDKTVVREYFNATGFDRWRRIYGDGEVNVVQKNIRIGHQQTIDYVVDWLKADGNLSDITICDAGCGVGSLSIPLVAAGATNIDASDISEMMVGEAKERAAAELDHPSAVKFEAKDLEEISGQYHTVICLDVLIHYPPEKAGEMIKNLSAHADTRFIVSFAPKTWYYDALKKIGEFFPGPSKATRAYLHPEAYIVKLLAENGWKVARNDISKAPFYFSRLLELVKA